MCLIFRTKVIRVVSVGYKRPGCSGTVPVRLLRTNWLDLAKFNSYAERNSFAARSRKDDEDVGAAACGTTLRRAKG